MVTGTEGALAVRAPTAPAFSALGAAVLSAALALVGRALPASEAFWLPIIGYLAGAVMVTVLVQIHRVSRNRASRSRWFNPDPRLDRVAVAAMTIGLVAALWHAFQIATELAK